MQHWNTGGGAVVGWQVCWLVCNKNINTNTYLVFGWFEVKVCDLGSCPFHWSGVPGRLAVGADDGEERVGDGGDGGGIRRSCGQENEEEDDDDHTGDNGDSSAIPFSTNHHDSKESHSNGQFAVLGI